MSTSWKIKTILSDKTGKSLIDSGSGIGATVVRSPRGALVPVRFKQGETLRMIDLLGDPDPAYPDLFEALEYNKRYPLYVSAPSKGGRFGGAYVTPTGIKTLKGGLAAMPVLGAKTLTIFEALGVGDGTTVAFGKTIGETTRYKALSFKVYVNGVALAGQSASGTTTETLSSTPSTVTGTLIKATGVLSTTFTTAPVAGAVVEVGYDMDVSDCYGVFVSAAPQKDFLGVRQTFDATTKQFTLTLSVADEFGTFNDKKTYVYSLEDSALDGFGKKISDEVIFAKDDYLQFLFVGKATTYTDDAAVVSLGGGSRGQVITGSDLASAWGQFASSRKYPISLGFDNSADPAIPPAFVALRQGDQAYTKFLCATPNTDETTTLAATIATSDKGIRFYYNYGKVSNSYNNRGDAWTSLIGEVAGNLADNIVNFFGGLAVSWTNENGVGGQLVSGRVLEMAFDPDQANLKSLEKARYNVIVMDPSNGVMILSERTSQTVISDYAWASYTDALEYIIQNVINNVLPAQIDKLNDEDHRSSVKRQCEAIIRPMTVRPRNVIFDFQVKCDAENNDDAALDAEEFHLAIAVKVTRKSRTIVLTFINTPQGLDFKAVFV